ncbi:MAG: nuclear transport factor 2 family protein [Candidatus Korobacteraceae bacterium]
MNRPTFAAIVLMALALNAAAQNTSTPSSKAAGSKSSATVDKAYLQSIWDGWASNDVEKQGRFYVQGPNHLFFDVAPLKYNSWDEYKAGVAPSLKDSPKVTFTLNDDIQIHPEGKITWVDGTLNMEGASPQGQKQTLTLRWTAILERQPDGRWLIQHEHVSVPAEPPQQ